MGTFCLQCRHMHCKAPDPISLVLQDGITLYAWCWVFVTAILMVRVGLIAILICGASYYAIMGALMLAEKNNSRIPYMFGKGLHLICVRTRRCLADLGPYCGLTLTLTNTQLKYCCQCHRDRPFHSAVSSFEESEFKKSYDQSDKDIPDDVAVEAIEVLSGHHHLHPYPRPSNGPQPTSTQSSRKWKGISFFVRWFSACFLLVSAPLCLFVG